MMLRLRCEAYVPEVCSTRRLSLKSLDEMLFQPTLGTLQDGVGHGYAGL